jgi:hypothetical protein
MLIGMFTRSALAQTDDAVADSPTTPWFSWPKTMPGSGTAFVDVQVRPTYRGRRDAHEDVRRCFDARILDLVDLNLVRSLVHDNLHRAPFRFASVRERTPA